MARGSNSSLVPPLEDPESALRKNEDKSVEDTNQLKKSPFKDLKSGFGKMRGKKVGESSSQKSEQSKIESFEHNPIPKETEYETKTETKEESDQESEPDNTMANIADMSMGEWKKRMHDDTRKGLVQPVIPTTGNFELERSHTRPTRGHPILREGSQRRIQAYRQGQRHSRLLQHP